MNKNKIHGQPVKSFFIHTITKDVTLDDCLLDLLDNCIDGAKRLLAKRQVSQNKENIYEGFDAHIVFSEGHFEIKDNCGGIPLAYAIDYAFHFGRRLDATDDAEAPLGLYGIGMKRAIFKIGKKIDITTSTDDIAYKVTIDVPVWQENTEDWDFDYEDAERWEHPGTIISIKELNDGVSDEFSDNSFQNRLIRIIARDYSFFLQKGFIVTVNNHDVKPHVFSLKESDDFKPINIAYNDEFENDVRVSIKAGMAKGPPEADTAEELEKIREPEYYGWFVACNDRIVLPGDKSDKTVWVLGMLWHPQYYGFMGIVNFESTNPNKLPWTTNKRALDPGSQLYRRALTKMKEVTRSYIDYTNQRKADLEKAKEAERKADARPINIILKSDHIVLPSFDRKPRVKMVNIQYQKPKELVTRVAESLGRAYMAYKDVGIETFNYYVNNELDEE